MTDEIAFLTAAEAGRRIAARTLSPVALVQACLDRIARYDHAVNAFITLLAEPAMAAARKAEAEIAAGRWRGPLHGIPFAVKDNYLTAGIRTTGGSRLMLDTVPDRTATIITRLEAAGAILLGKLNTWEYGTGNGGVYHDLPFPVARNPWNLEHFTGGSSTGAGAAVAAGFVSFALGSDTGGSIRFPAAACGLAGLKPTYGLVSRAGMLPNCWSLDVAGPLCHDAEDAALVLNAIAGADPADAGSVEHPRLDYRAALDAGVRGLTIGLISDTGPGDGPCPANAAALAEVADMLEGAGARVVPLAVPAPMADFRRAATTINSSESFSIHEQDATGRPHLMGRALREKMMTGATIRAADYLAAQRLRRELAVAVERMFGLVDLLLLPGAYHLAPPFADEAKVMAFTRESTMNIFSLSGHPAIAVPAGLDSETGLPRHVQLGARWFDEATLLRATRAIETLSSWQPARPTLPEATP